MSRADSPLKVSRTTKEKIRLAAALLDVRQAEFVEAAVDEAVERRAAEFAQGVEKARKALLSGTLDAAAYLLDEDPQQLRKRITRVVNDD